MYTLSYQHSEKVHRLLTRMSIYLRAYLSNHAKTKTDGNLDRRGAAVARLDTADDSRRDATKEGIQPHQCMGLRKRSPRGILEGGAVWNQQGKPNEGRRVGLTKSVGHPQRARRQTTHL